MDMTSFIMNNRDFHTMQDKPITIPWTSVSSTRFSHAQIQTGRDPKQRRTAHIQLYIVHRRASSVVRDEVRLFLSPTDVLC